MITFLALFLSLAQIAADPPICGGGPLDDLRDDVTSALQFEVLAVQRNAVRAAAGSPQAGRGALLGGGLEDMLPIMRNPQSPQHVVKRTVRLDAGNNISVPETASTSTTTTTSVAGSRIVHIGRCFNLTRVNGTILDSNRDGRVSPGECLRIPRSFPGHIPLHDAIAKIGTETVQYRVAFDDDCPGYQIMHVLESQTMNITWNDTHNSTPTPMAACPRGQRFVNLSLSMNQSWSFTNASARDKGRDPHSCDQYGDDFKRSGSACYTKCKNGYNSSGPLCVKANCTERVHPRHRSDDLAYFRPGSYKRENATAPRYQSYGKGCCCTDFGCCGCLKGFDDHGCYCDRRQGCNEEGYVECSGLCYKTCAKGFHNVSCSVCSPDKSSNATPLLSSQSCLNDSYVREGNRLGCAKSEDLDGGLCYSQCAKGSRGSGPWCYQDCSVDRRYHLGVWCYRDKLHRNELLDLIIGGSIAGVALLPMPGIVGSHGLAATLFINHAQMGSSTSSSPSTQSFVSPSWTVADAYSFESANETLSMIELVEIENIVFEEEDDSAEEF